MKELPSVQIISAYGLPKIHKTGNPLRMIVSLVDSPTYKLSKWMFNHLRPLIADSEHSLTNSLEFLESIKRTNIAPNECMLSFDIVSLFTSIPLELARETIIHLLDDFDLGLPPTATIELLDHCLSNFFQFNNCLYQQIKGTPMGSPISGLIAEAVLQRLERKVFTDISPKFWKRNSALHHRTIPSPPDANSEVNPPTWRSLPYVSIIEKSDFITYTLDKQN